MCVPLEHNAKTCNRPKPILQSVRHPSANRVEESRDACDTCDTKRNKKAIMGTNEQSRYYNITQYSSTVRATNEQNAYYNITQYCSKYG